ncbi:MAG: S8 family serine peptidase [Chloroflexi bacterium]|nr:S8 family serine peptidase [Chloroflexota bacterium]
MDARILVVVMLIGGLLTPNTWAANPRIADPAGAEQYIVAIKAGRDARGVARAAGVTPNHVFGRALNGFVATLNASQRTALAQHPDVAMVEPDQPIQATANQIIDPTSGLWGLDRIDQRPLPLSGNYTYTNSASGVTAYLIDSGLQANHPDFGGRAQNMYDAFGESGNDCNGHGTHLAGIIGGTTHGVAKQVNLRGVRVLQCDGQGFLSDTIRGLDWVTTNAVKPAVATLAVAPKDVTSANSGTLQLAVEGLINAGVFVAVAAGNNNADACTSAPSNISGAFTVAASTRTDQRYTSSNYGACVDIYAPGAGITSAWIGSTTNTLSGTSQATAFVAGVAALYKASYGDQTQAEINSWLISNATQALIQNNPSATPNRLLYSLETTAIDPRSVSAGIEYACGIRSDQTITCWGRNDYGQSTPPSGSFSQLSTGGIHTCAIRTNGTIACWGNNVNGQATPPSGTFTHVSSGRTNNCALGTSQTLACWGLNLSGQSSPPSGTFSQVSAGSEHVCGIRTSGTIACWGLNSSGQSSPPSGTFSQVSAGNNHTCAIDLAGLVVCWGSNSSGKATPPSGTFSQVGAGDEFSCGLLTNQTVACWGSSSSGKTTPPSSTFTQIDVGGTFTCGLRTDYTLACWGHNSYGQANPPSISITQVNAGDTHTCGLRTDQTIDCWGSNGNDKITAPSGTFTQIDAGGEHTCAVRTSQALACWGNNTFGQRTPPSGNFSRVSAGGSHSCGVRDTGLIACWGLNTSGQATPPSNSFTQIAAGNNHSCGLLTTGSILCWGNNANGQATPPSGSFTQVSAGSNHSCGLTTSQTIVCWGNNSFGQTTVPGGSFTHVSTGDSYTCGVRPSSTITVECWGKNDAAQAMPRTLWY